MDVVAVLVRGNGVKVLDRESIGCEPLMLSVYLLMLVCREASWGEYNFQGFNLINNTFETVYVDGTDYTIENESLGSVACCLTPIPM